MVEEPYGKQPMTLQFEPPRDPKKMEAFIGWMLDDLGKFPGALVQITDWYGCDDTPESLAKFRQGHDECRPWPDAPGHLYAPTAAAEAISLCHLAVAEHLSVYLYLASGAATIYFWEGDLIDYFGWDETFHQVLYENVRLFDLNITYDSKVS